MYFILVLRCLTPISETIRLCGLCDHYINRWRASCDCRDFAISMRQTSHRTAGKHRVRHRAGYDRGDAVSEWSAPHKSEASHLWWWMTSSTSRCVRGRCVMYVCVWWICFQYTKPGNVLWKTVIRCECWV